MNWTDLMLRLRALLFRRRVEQELDEEMKFHLEMAARKQAAAGMEEAEALRLARVQFGGVEQVKEECRTLRGTQFIETSLQDIRYASRSFIRNPLFVMTVVGTIALGLGLNTALFTIFNAYVLRPVSVRDPQSIYSLTWTDRSARTHVFSWREFESLRRQNSVFSEAAAALFLFARVDGHPLMGRLVSGNYFAMLGVKAALGRVLLPEDSASPGGEAVIVLSYTAWQNKFGADPHIVGRKLLLHGHPLEVIGIAKPGFNDLGNTPIEYWVPLTMSPLLENEPDLFGPEQPERLRLVGRLKPGLGKTQAAAALTGWVQRLTGDRPAADKAGGADLRSEATAIPLTPEILIELLPLLTAFGLVLLLGCANVANMMLARAMARQREIGIRLSLGAARRRLIRQLLTESVLLALPAGLAGAAVSKITIEVGLRMMFATLPADFAEIVSIVPLPLDARVLGFMMSAALASAVLFGLAPAIQMTRGDVMLAARGEFTSDVRPMRLRNALVVGQVTVCMLLLTCSAILLRSAGRMAEFDVGVRTQGVVVMGVEERYRSRLLQRLAVEPLVEEIGAASSTPLNGILPSVPISAGETSLDSWYNYASPEFFTVLQIPILRGRNFSADEARSGAPVAILSRITAEKLWPGRNPIGQTIHVRPKARAAAGEATPGLQDVRVIGVAGDIVSCSLPYGKDPAVIYLPSTAERAHSGLVIRVRGNDAAIARRLDGELSAAVPGAIEEIHAMDQYVAGGIYPFRVAAWIGSALGGLALLLTLSGIYGVLAYLITQRTREIGIRVALGASTSSVTRLVLGRSMQLAAIGIGLGVVLALAVSRVFASSVVFVVFMNTFDPIAYGGGLLAVVLAALSAAYFPARRAARIDPMTTLRAD